MYISERIAHISASPTLAMAAKAAAMKAAGENILSMSLGEPDFPTPAHVKQAVKEAVDADLSHYGPVPGMPGLRAAAAKYMSSGLITLFLLPKISLYRWVPSKLSAML